MAVTDGEAGGLFSIQGRIGRATWWGVQIVLTIASYLFLAILDTLPEESEATLLFALVGVVLLLGISTAADIKRWHDRDKSGWMVLILLIPIVGALWSLIELGFLRGTEGENRFGRDPLGPAPLFSEERSYDVQDRDTSGATSSREGSQ